MFEIPATQIAFNLHTWTLLNVLDGGVHLKLGDTEATCGSRISFVLEKKRKEIGQYESDQKQSVFAFVGKSHDKQYANLFFYFFYKQRFSSAAATLAINKW